MKILLPVDGSACAQRAVRHVIDLGKALREVPEIHLVHVHPPIPMGRVQTHVGRETLHDYYREESEQQLLAAQALLDEAGCRYQRHIHVGQPAEVIGRMIGEIACDLVVMGSQGHGWVAGLLMGSVATRVLHATTCPVTLVK